MSNVRASSHVTSLLSHLLLNFLAILSALFTNMLKALEQERYSLNMRLNQHQKMAASYEEELDGLRNQIASERVSIIVQANAEHSGKIAQLQRQVFKG